MLRLAMWSGPRNISTALMRSFGNREDTFVCDEPLYAHYLRATGKPHPMAAEVMASGETDWRRVVEGLSSEVRAGKSIHYQKHMAHHLLPEISRGWLDSVTNVFLVRDPSEMLASLEEKLEDPVLEDTGLPQQLEIFRLVAERTGSLPSVIDARDVLEDPRRVLSALCRALGISFSRRMLQWPPGQRPTDGVWARHWYQNVIATTGFEPYRPRRRGVSASLRGLLESCRELYRELYAHRLTGDDDDAPEVRRTES